MLAIGIIDHGKILALGSLDELLAHLPFEEQLSFAATPATADFTPALSRLGTVATDNGVHRFRPDAATRMSEFYALAEQHALPPRLFAHERPTLEALFLHLTGRTLRE